MKISKMMTKILSSWPYLSGIIFLGSLATMSAVHYQQIKVSEQHTHELSKWVAKERIANEMTFSMEDYRRQAGSFRKLGEGASSSAKSHLRQEFVKKSQALENLGLSPADHTLLSEANDRLSQFLVMSAKIEPTLFTWNFYQKPEGVDLHNRILEPLKQLQLNSQAAETELYQPTSNKVYGFESIQILLVCSGLLLFVVLTHMMIAYFKNVLPAQRLQKAALFYKKGDFTEMTTSLRGLYGDVENVLKELATTVRSQRFEKHEFIAAITSELRSPLLNLRTGVSLYEDAEANSQKRSQGKNLIERSSARLSRCLNDLTDIAETENSHLSLNEKIVDLGELVQGLAKITDLNPVNNHEVRVKSISDNLWANIDADKMERALNRLIGLLMENSPGGAAIELSIQNRNDDAFKGVEILIEEADRFRSGRAGATGPEQDLLKHWTTANGYGMRLTEKIVKAHGGRVTASGVVGTGVLFIVRIPQYRIAVSKSANQPLTRAALRLETKEFAFDN
jgi:signal transduction histidine kinase